MLLHDRVEEQRLPLRAPVQLIQPLIVYSAQALPSLPTAGNMAPAFVQIYGLLNIIGETDVESFLVEDTLLDNET